MCERERCRLRKWDRLLGRERWVSWESAGEMREKVVDSESEIGF